MITRRGVIRAADGRFAIRTTRTFRRPWRRSARRPEACSLTRTARLQPAATTTRRLATVRRPARSTIRWRHVRPLRQVTATRTDFPRTTEPEVLVYVRLVDFGGLGGLIGLPGRVEVGVGVGVGVAGGTGAGVAV